MKLIPDWKNAYKYFSTQAMALTLAVQTTWASLPDEFKSKLPEGTAYWLSLVLLVGGIVGRLVSQGAKNDKAIDE